MSWATDIVKKKQNAQGQALNRTSFDALFGSAGVTGQQGGVQTQTSPTPQSSAADEGVKADNTPINYGSGVGLIPGTTAYAEWQKSQGSGVTPDGGPIKEANPAGTTDPPEPAPAPASVYNVSTGRGSFTVDRAAIDNIVNTLPPNVQSAVKGMLASGNISLGGDTLRQLVNAGVPISTLMQLQKAIKQGTGMTKQDWMGGKLGNMNTGRNFENYRPGWMQKRIDRNMAAWEAEQQPQAPDKMGDMMYRDPNMPPGGYPGLSTSIGSFPPATRETGALKAIDASQLPQGFTPEMTYPDGSVIAARGPDGMVWSIGPDGMPAKNPMWDTPIYAMGGQAPQQTNYPNYNPAPLGTSQYPVQGGGYPDGSQIPPGLTPVYDKSGRISGATDQYGQRLSYDPSTGQFGNYGGTVTNPGFMPYNPAQQLPPDMMNYLMSQLPYFNMYMNGMYGQ